LDLNELRGEIFNSKKSPRSTIKSEHPEIEPEETVSDLVLDKNRSKYLSSDHLENLIDKSTRNISTDERTRRHSGVKTAHKSPKEKKSQTEEKKAIKKRKKEGVNKNPADKDLVLISKWLNKILNEDLPSEREAFFKRLKDGTVLCRTINVLRKGAIKNIHILPHLESLVTENLNNFIDACIYTLGMNRLDLFEPNDLILEEDILKVIDTLLKLINLYYSQKESILHDVVYSDTNVEDKSCN